MRSYSQSVYDVSRIALGVSTAADLASSHGLIEHNRLLASRDGSFGKRAIVITSLTTIGVLLAESRIIKSKPHAKRLIAVCNFAVSGLHVWRASVQFPIKR